MGNGRRLIRHECSCIISALNSMSSIHSGRVIYVSAYTWLIRSYWAYKLVTSIRLNRSYESICLKLCFWNQYNLDITIKNDVIYGFFSYLNAYKLIEWLINVTEKFIGLRYLNCLECSVGELASFPVPGLPISLYCRPRRRGCDIRTVMVIYHLVFPLVKAFDFVDHLTITVHLAS